MLYEVDILHINCSTYFFHTILDISYKLGEMAYLPELILPFPPNT